MASDIDARLAAFGPRDVTLLGTNALLRVLPFADPVPPASNLADIARTMNLTLTPAQAARAEALVHEDRSRRALWLATGLDAGDGIITVLSSIKSAIALYMGRHGGARPPTGWSDHQAGDAVLKALAIGYLFDLCFPNSEDPIVDLAWLPSGRALLAYFATAEVALPFVEGLVDGTHALSVLLPIHVDAQARKLATVVGSAPVQAARQHLPALAPVADALVAASAGYLSPFAQSVEERIAGSTRVVDRVGDVVAAGADILPVYRLLGLRVVAEAAVLRAVLESGVSPPLAGGEWLQQFVIAPRAAAQPLPAAITASGWEDGVPTEGPVPATDSSEDITFSDDALRTEAATAAAFSPPPVAAPNVPPLPSAVAATAPHEPPPSHTPPPLPVGARPPAVPLAAPPTPVVPPPLPAEAPVASAPPPLPQDVFARSEAAPPPLPVDAPAPVAAPPKPAVPPVPTVQEQAPPPLPVQAPRPSAPAAESPPPKAPPAAPAPALAPTAAPPPRPVIPVPSAAVGPKPPPTKSPARPSSPEAQPTMNPPPPAPSSAPEPSAEGGGISWTAVAIALVLLLALGCAGVFGMGGAGAVFWGAHQETSEDGANGGKTTPKTDKAQPNKGKKGGKKSGKKSGKKKP